MRMAILSLLAMFVLSLSAGLAMSMKGRMGISLALSAKLGTRGIKVNEANLDCVICHMLIFIFFVHIVQLGKLQKTIAMEDSKFEY